MRFRPRLGPAPTEARSADTEKPSYFFPRATESVARQCPGLKYGAPGELVPAMRAWRFASRRTAKFQTEKLPTHKKNGWIVVNFGP